MSFGNYMEAFERHHHRSVCVIIDAQRLEFKAARYPNDTDEKYFAEVYKKLKEVYPIKVSFSCVQFAYVKEQSSWDKDTLRLMYGVKHGDRFIDVSRLSYTVTDNGHIICPDRDIFPDYWSKSTKSIVCTGPIRLRLCMQAAAADRFIVLLQQYKDDENVINAVGETFNTWLHFLCQGRSPCGRGYSVCKDQWLKMTKAFISTVDVSWMLEHKNVNGQTPMDLAKLCGVEMAQLLTTEFKV